MIHIIARETDVWHLRIDLSECFVVDSVDSVFVALEERQYRRAGVPVQQHNQRLARCTGALSHMQREGYMYSRKAL